jgi:hypothetical protein
MTSTSCIFVLTKSLDLPLYYFFFLHIYDYDVIDSLAEDGYRKAFTSYRGFDLGDAWGLIASLGRYSW